MIKAITIYISVLSFVVSAGADVGYYISGGRAPEPTAERYLPGDKVLPIS